jgi:hypothetical protein
MCSMPAMLYSFTSCGADLGLRRARGLVAHRRDLVARADELLRVAVALEAPLHLER